MVKQNNVHSTGKIEGQFGINFYKLSYVVRTRWLPVHVVYSMCNCVFVFYTYSLILKCSCTIKISHISTC